MKQESQELEKTLQKPDIHNSWENAYRTPENVLYYDLALDYIAGCLEATDTLTLLDAGCGICDYSLRLARHDFSITAVDFSESVLKNAAVNVRKHGFQDKIVLQRESLLSLSFADESFDNILCWGVLMHIPEADKAIAELCRVVKRGGRIVISESNMHSAESVMLRTVKQLLGRQKEKIARTAAGIENWADSAAGTLVSREFDIGWLVQEFDRHGVQVEKHVAGQFSELYVRLRVPVIQKLIHFFNRVWFRFVKSPGLAFGNIIVFVKK